MRRVKKIVVWIATLYILAGILLYFFQHKIIFQPESLPVNYVYHFEYPFEEFFLKASDGERLNGIHFTTENPKGVLLYFHGNRGNLKRWGRITSFFVSKGYDVVVMDYRTYGKSTGTSIIEQDLYTDAELFYRYIKEKYTEDQIIVYGRSLGTGIASKIASENQPRSLILETPYYSMEELASDKVPVLPVKFLLKYKFPSNEFIKKVNCPITIYHGTDDTVVPYDSGKKLFDNIPTENKQMITIEGGTHNNLIQFDEYLNSIDLVLVKI